MRQRLAVFLTFISFPIILATAASPPDTAVGLGEAREELFAARFSSAAVLYRKALADNPLRPDAYYGLVRALIEDRHAKDAYAAASRAGPTPI